MRNFISPIIAQKIPEFIKQDFKKLATFIKYFYEFLETQGNPLEILETFYENSEANYEVDGFIDKILVECGFDINKQIFISKKELILHLRDFYLSRGNEQSFKFIFKLLFNIDIEIDYPRKRLFVTSQATYSNRFFIFTTSQTFGSVNYNIIIQEARNYSLKIYGISSKTECFVEDIQFEYSKGRMYYKIQIDSNKKQFHVGEGLKIISLKDNVEIIENVVDVYTLDIDNPGNGYKINDKITISNVNITGSANIKTLKEGQIDDIVITNGGENYAVGDQIFTSKRERGHSFSAVVSSIDNTLSYLSIDTDVTLQLETGDFTIEAWINRPFHKLEQVIATNKHSTLNRGWTFKLDPDRKLVFEIYKGNITYTIKSYIEIPYNEWTHIAAVRENDVIQLFINGIRCAEEAVTDGTVSNETIRIGNNRTGTAPLIGLMSEFRITRMARYDTTFSITPIAFTHTESNYADVALLIHFVGILNLQNFVDSSSSPKTITTSGAIFITDEKAIIDSRCVNFSGLGSINSISIYNHGYNYDTLPEINIISLKGDNAVLTPQGLQIGQIESISIINPFGDLILGSTPAVTISSENGVGAVLTPRQTTIYSESSTWKTLDGMLGINCQILDSYYFQQFSYLIKSSISRKDYDDIIDSWLHPSGFVRFATYSIEFSNQFFNTTGEYDKIFTLTKVLNVVGYDDEFSCLDQVYDLPIIKLYYTKDNRLIVNPQSRLDEFKELIDNYKFTVDEWDYITVGDPPLGTTDQALISRKRVNDNSIMMNKTLDAQIDILVT